MIFIYKTTEVKFCISLRKYRDVTITTNEASAYAVCSQPHRKLIVTAMRLKFSQIILPYSQSFPHDLPRMTSLSPTGGGWQATRPISRVKWLWRHRQTRRNGNVVRPDSSNFPTFTSEKYLFGTYRRKLINIYCPLVTEKSTNPRVKLTCPCLGKPRHGLSKFDIRVSWFLSHHRTIEVDSIILPYSQSFPHDLPRMTSLSPTGGWMTSYTRFISRVKRLWCHRQTRRNGNVVRLDSSNFPTFTSEKYLFEAYRRKIINIYCPLVTEKSTNPRVKLTCPCLGKPRHGLSELDTRVSWFLSHHRTIDVDSINLQMMAVQKIGK